MNLLKKIVIFIFKIINDIKQLKLLVQNYLRDFSLYRKHSTVFKYNNLNKIESRLILDYHSVEKGMLYYKTKPRFAKERIVNLIKFINGSDLISIEDKTQITVTYKIMCKYFEMHKELNISIEDYFPEVMYNKIRQKLKNSYSEEFKGIIEFSKDDFYKNAKDNFYDFSNSRKSVRDFTGELIDIELITKAVQLALNAPSVCNRQSSKVYLLKDKNKIDKALEVQGGFTGHSKNVSQLLILTVNRNYFYTVGERNQMFIDGGVFLMNLLYSLHFYQIANCPANWGKTIAEEKEFDKIVSIAKNEKIICFIPIGLVKDEFRVTLSKRRKVNEIFSEI
jgi:nitroreductase